MYRVTNVTHKSNFTRILVCFKTITNQPQFSSLTTASSSPDPTQPLLIVEHLINEYGVSRQKATSLSKVLPQSPSPVTLSSVPNFFKQIGFPETHIRNIISKIPKLLFSKIDKTLEPKIKILEKEIGFSGSSLYNLIANNPSILFCSKDNRLIPAINVLRSVLHSNDKIVKVLNKHSRLLCRGKQLVTNVDFLRQYGLSDQVISLLLCQTPRIFVYKVSLIKDIVERVEKLGVKRDSPCFLYAVFTIASMSKSTLDSKFQLYKSYGFSESDILCAFKKWPKFLCLSEEKIRKVLSFLIHDHKFMPECIALMPILFNFSVEKRLKPRIKVMEILYSKWLLKKSYHLSSILVISDMKFVEKFVIKFLDRAPELEDALKTCDLQWKKILAIKL